MDPILVKWTVMANIDVWEDGRMEMLHRELDFLTEEEADAWVAEHTEYEKIPVYRG